MDVTEYLRILRSRWSIVLAAVIVALASAWFTTSVAKIGTSPSTSYQASTVLLGTGTTGGLSLETIASLAKIEPVAAAVAQRMDYQGEPLDLSNDISVLADQSGTLTITAISPSAQRAKFLADTWTAELINYLNHRSIQTATAQAQAIQEQLDQLTEDIADLRRQIAATPDSQDDLLEAELSAKTSLYGSLYQQQQSALSSGLEPVGLDVLQEATPVPVSTGGFQPPRSRTVRMLIGLLIGLLLGAGLALIVERARSPIRTKQAAEEHLGYPVIAEIPPPPSGRHTRVVTAVSPQSRAAQAFRLLAATLSRLHSAEGTSGSSDPRLGESVPQTILVTSAGPSEGKTTVVANLSAALADLGKRVLVLSCDFHRPLIHEYFGVPATPGLAESLASSNGQSVLNGNVWKSTVDDVDVVPSGRRPTKPGELLNSGNMRRALDEAQGLADVVILDTAPLLAEGDVAHLLPAVDAVLIVARAGKTSQQVAERAHEFLERLGAPVVGVVLTNAVETAVPRRYYGYGPAKEEQELSTESGPRSVVGDFPDSRDTGPASSV